MLGDETTMGISSKFVDLCILDYSGVSTKFVPYVTWYLKYNYINAVAVETILLFTIAINICGVNLFSIRC